MNQNFKNPKALTGRAIEAVKRKGIRYVVGYAVKRVSHSSAVHYPQCLFYKTARLGKKFVFRGESYKYFYHPYHYTWRNERAVEIPIIWNLVKSAGNKRVLEVGNVLSHYYKIDHDVVDKYEQGLGIIHEDVLTFDTSKRYDLIISISTMEHVGWDEREAQNNQDSDKIPRALKNLERLLDKNAKLVVTMPIGYNPFVSKLLKSNHSLFSEIYFLKRISAENDWVQSELEDIDNIKYKHPFEGANWLLVGFTEK